MSCRKRIQSLALSGALSLSLFTGAWAQDISVQLDGRVLQFDQPPARVAGRLLVPLRGIFEALKADVVYDGATRSIQATKGSRVIQLQLGSRTAIIDGRTLFLDVPADTIGGRTMVPLRFVAEALGADVKWDGATKTVKMSSGGPDSVADAPSPTPSSPNGPRIERVFHSGTTALKPGDSLDVIAYGEPGATATFEILGATNQIALPEVSSGKYQSRWTIPNGLEVEQGVLLVHLRKNGRETATEADRQITVRGGSGQAGPSASDWVTDPVAQGTVGEMRPQVSLTFPAPIQAGTVRFFVDGIDFTRQVNLQGQSLTWTPTYNLSQAQHQAEVEAVSSAGQKLTHRWTFRIDPTAVGQNFQIAEIYPADNEIVGPRPRIGARFSERLSSVSMVVDQRAITGGAGVERLNDGFFWTPNSDLSPGAHQVRMRGIQQNGRVAEKSWNFTVVNNTIRNFTFSPTTARSGQQVKVALDGPTGARGSFQVGQVENLALRETAQGRYEGVYTVSSRDSGTAQVSATLRLPSGETVVSTASNRLNFQASPTLTVSNLSNGMSISPVFNVQGKGEPGSTVSVVVEYSSSNILGAITGQVRRLQTQGVVGANGFYDIPVDASSVDSGQQMRVTVSDGQARPIQITMTRR